MVNAGKYPVGTQTFRVIREQGMLYADKTALIYQLVNSMRYVFLSRPRRFGKSLLCSTLESYFEGRRELFEGLAIDSLETEWKKHPVIHLSFARIKSMTAEQMMTSIHTTFVECENKLGLPEQDKPTMSEAFEDRLYKLIVGAYKKYGEQVVVVIDEYDAPLLNVLHRPEELEKVRQMMRAIYAPLKDCDQYLRFVFISGLTKFSQLSIFSELNNLKNISMLPKYATLCGFTQQEIETTFGGGVDDLATTLKITRNDALKLLRTNYDGYHFAANSEGVYNPFSLLNALDDKAINSYWFASGTPTFLIEKLKEFQPDITTIDGCTARVTAFDAPTEDLKSILPLFYQSGYLTIKDFNPRYELYTLGYPNKEVRLGLMEALYPYYSTQNEYDYTAAAEICENLRMGNIAGALDFIRSFLKSVPYEEGTRHSEGHYRQMLYLFFALLGQYVQAEVRTSNGRVDIVLSNKDYIYVMECKLDGSVDEALRQIDEKGYAIAWKADGRKLFKVGINFSIASGTVEDWKIVGTE